MDFVCFNERIKNRNSLEFSKGEWLMPMLKKDLLLKILNSKEKRTLTIKRIKELYQRLDNSFDFSLQRNRIYLTKKLGYKFAYPNIKNIRLNDTFLLIGLPKR